MKLVQTTDYLLLIDEEAEISKTGTLIYENDTNILNITGVDYEPQGIDSKVIAYRPLAKEAKELDLPLLPPFEEDVNIEKLACAKYNVKDGIRDYDERYYNTINVAKAEAFIEGYKVAQPKQFSLEDIVNAFSAGEASVIHRIVQERDDYLTIEEYIQSLSTQQLPKEFIISDKFSTFEENIKYGKYIW